jgi:hypothetical protein
MGKRCKVSIKYFFGGLAFLLFLFITLRIDARDKHKHIFVKSLTDGSDTTKKKQRSTAAVIAGDTTKNRQDTTKKQRVDTLTVSKDSLDAPVKYSAEDSAVLIITTKNFTLYNKASTHYKDMQLDANTIRYNQQEQVVQAYGGTDTSNNPLNKPKLVQGGATSIMDSVRMNLHNMRGLSKNAYYQEGEMFVHAQTMKKVDKDVAYALRTRFTTCNLDTPHFDIVARKVKLITNKIAVSGPAFPEFEGVPMPVAIPFGIYPLARGRHSGLLPPSFANNQDYGLGLENLGYYKVINDNWDVTTRASIYTYGGWNLVINPKYIKRYKYSGNLNLSIQHTVILNSSGTALEEFSKTSSFMLNWSHTTDNRARPGTSFSASVNAGSTKYNRYVAYNNMLNYQNQLSSSVTYSKTWDQGRYNLTVSANHNQNNNTRLVNVTLPTVNFTANTFYPFQKKEVVGTPKWYEKLGISYTGTLLNQVSFYDSAISVRRLLDTTQWGAQHNIPITISLPALGPLIFSPSISYAEKWYGQKIELSDWGKGPSKLNKVDTSISRGFFRAQEVQFGLSMNTRIFGTFQFGKSTALRHEIKPFISLNYKPDLVGKYYKTLHYDSTVLTKYDPVSGRDSANRRRVSVFDGSPMGSFSEGTFGGLNFGFDNLFEMKVKNKKDSTGDAPTKKIRLIDGLSFNSGYNYLADSLKWQPVTIALRSTLFEKVNLTGSATIDPYAVDSTGNRINKLLWKQGSIGRFTGGNIALSTSFQSKANDKRKDSDRMPIDETMTPDEQLRQLDYVRSNPAEFVDFNIPWTLQASMSVNFSRILSPDLKNYVTQVNSNVSLNGDFSLTPKWKIGGTTYFDFRTAKIQTLTMFVTREMHCWQMAINITPIGLQKSFSIVLNPKSGILRDLKINRSRFFYNQ